jgi:hypothetical protein
MFGFEKLDVWRKAIQLTDSVYAFTRPFPSDERFGPPVKCVGRRCPLHPTSQKGAAAGPTRTLQGLLSFRTAPLWN